MSSNSLQCLAQHALGDMSAAATSADVAQALADHTDQRRPGQGQQRDAAIPSALQRIGALRLAMVSRPCTEYLFLRGRQDHAQSHTLVTSLAPQWEGQGGMHTRAHDEIKPAIGAQGNYEEATSLFRRAAAGASQALPAGGSTSPGSRLEPSPWALREAAASAVSGVGQASLARAQWDAAEEPLSEVRLSYGVLQALSVHCHTRSPGVNILKCWPGLIGPEAVGSC